MLDGNVRELLAAVTTWADTRADIPALALVGSRGRGTARPDSDIDLVLLVRNPQTFRSDRLWLEEIRWDQRRIQAWYDADYGAVWSRHVTSECSCEVEFTFCEASWAATDPVDPGTSRVVADGCRILLDKARVLENLLAAASP